MPAAVRHCTVAGARNGGAVMHSFATFGIPACGPESRLYQWLCWGLPSPLAPKASQTRTFRQLIPCMIFALCHDHYTTPIVIGTRRPVKPLTKLALYTPAQARRPRFLASFTVVIECKLSTPNQQCNWTYNLDCRQDQSCPWSYRIACVQKQAQKCTWTYSMICPRTVPAPPPTCPWQYNITCA